MMEKVDLARESEHGLKGGERGEDGLDSGKRAGLVDLRDFVFGFSISYGCGRRWLWSRTRRRWGLR